MGRGGQLLLIRAVGTHGSSFDAWANAGSARLLRATQFLSCAGPNREVAIEKLAPLAFELRGHSLQPNHLLFEPLLFGEADCAQHVGAKFAALEAKGELRKLRQSQLRHPRKSARVYRATAAPPMTKLGASPDW